MRLVGWLLAAVLFPMSAMGEVGNLTSDQLQAFIDRGVPVVDVRTPGEWKQTGVIKGSHLLTFFDERGRVDVNTWMAAFSKIADANDEVVLVCRSGNRTGQITQFLDQKAGYKKVFHLSRGMNQWIADRKPVARQ